MGRGRGWIGCAVAGAAAALLVLPAGAKTPPKKPKPKPPPVGSIVQVGCVADSQLGDTRCTKVRGLKNSAFLVLSPDGRFLYATARDGDSIAIFQRNATTGVLTQLPGAAGCLRDVGSPDTSCAGTAVGIDRASGVTVSPDGRFLYVAGRDSNAVVIFGRNTSTGTLTEIGCVTDATSPEKDCAPFGKGLRGTQGITISRDGRTLYVTGIDSDAIAWFRREADGTLHEPGCISNLGADRSCESGTGLDGASSVTVSPDGRNVYATGPYTSAVAIFQRREDGSLAELGCISGDAGYRQDPKCAAGRGIQFAQSSTVSPDGKFVYVSATDSHVLGVFARDPGTGMLTQLPDTAGCLRDRSYPTRVPCRTATGIALPLAFAITRNGRFAYLAAFGYGSVTAYSRNLVTGGLTQIGKCIANDDPRCPRGKGLTRAGFLAISPDEKHLYVNAPSGSSIAIFRRVLR